MTPSGSRPNDGERRNKPKPVTPIYLERAALHYLERYTSTAENLRRVLARKAKKRLGPDGEAPTDLDRTIADTVERAVRSGLIDDGRYAEMKVSSLARRGTSSRAMSGHLRHKGVPTEIARVAIGAAELDDLALARRFAERKRLGPFRPRPDPDKRDRDLAAMARAGFPYRIAAQTLDAPLDDPELS